MYYVTEQTDFHLIFFSISTLYSTPVCFSCFLPNRLKMKMTTQLILLFQGYEGPLDDDGSMMSSASAAAANELFSMGGGDDDDLGAIGEASQVGYVKCYVVYNV
jgi:hypothetical protein